MPFEDTKPGDPIRASDLRQVGRALQRMKTFSEQGDGAPGQDTQIAPGRGRSTSDHGKVFFVKITEDLGAFGDKHGYRFVEVGINHDRDAETAETVTIDGGKISTQEVPAFGISDTEFAVNDTALARRSWRSPYCWELFSSTGGTSVGGFWARLISKSYAGDCPVYGYRKLRPSLSCASVWEEIPDSDGTIYEVNGVDLPVHDAGSGSGSGDDMPNHGTVVWVILTPSVSESGSGSESSGSDAGTITLFEQTPRWEFVEVVGEPDGDGLVPAQMLRYTVGGGWAAVEDVYLVDANAV